MSKLHLDNLYRHADGGLYCLMIEDAALKNPAGEGAWLDAVIYLGEDGKFRSTTTDRWAARFEKVEEIAVADLTDDQLNMVRRANPGDPDMDFIKVFESWGESEANMTGHMIELAVGAAMVSFYWGGAKRSHEDFPGTRKIKTAELTIKTEDLQHVLQNYEIKRIAQPHGFTFQVEKSFPDSA